MCIREDVAEYIRRRDGYEAYPCDILLCAGATEGIRALIKLLNYPQGHKDGEQPGVLVPVPQYPLFQWTLTEYSMRSVGTSHTTYNCREHFLFTSELFLYDHVGILGFTLNIWNWVGLLVL